MQADIRTRRAAAVFTVHDEFLQEWGAARQPVPVLDPVRFTVTGRGPVPAGWLVDVRRNAGGAYVTLGGLIRPDGTRYRLHGSDLDLELEVSCPGYRPLSAPVQVRLVNLDHTLATTVTPVEIGLRPGPAYAFRSSASRYAIVRGEVRTAAASGALTVSASSNGWQDTFPLGPGGQFVFVVPATGSGPVAVGIDVQTGTGSGHSVSISLAGPGEYAVPPIVVDQSIARP